MVRHGSPLWSVSAFGSPKLRGIRKGSSLPSDSLIAFWTPSGICSACWCLKRLGLFSTYTRPGLLLYLLCALSACFVWWLWRHHFGSLTRCILASIKEFELRVNPVDWRATWSEGQSTWGRYSWRATYIYKNFIARLVPGLDHKPAPENSKLMHARIAEEATCLYMYTYGIPFLRKDFFVRRSADWFIFSAALCSIPLQHLV